MGKIDAARKTAHAVCSDPDSTGREMRDAIEPFYDAVEDFVHSQGPTDRGNPEVVAALRIEIAALEAKAAAKEAEEKRDDGFEGAENPGDK